MRKLPSGIDLEQMTRAADLDRAAREAVLRIRNEMIDGMQKAAQALRIVPPERPSIGAYLQTIGAHIQTAFRDALRVPDIAELTRGWKEGAGPAPGPGSR